MTASNNPRFDIYKFAVFAAIFILIAFLLLSCNSVKKTTSTVKTNTDSVQVSKTDATEVSKKDSAGTKSETGNYQKETIYHYDTVYIIKDGIPIVKYVPRIVKVYEKGNYVTNETATKTSIDSSVLKQSDSTKLEKKVVVRETDKKSSRMPLLWLVIACVVVAGGLYYGGKFIKV